MQTKFLIWAAWGGLFAVWMFGAGVMIGRQIPAHRYERLGNTSYLLDVPTGGLCNAFPSTTVKTSDGFEIKDPNPVDQTLADGNHIPPCNPK